MNGKTLGLIVGIGIVAILLGVGIGILLAPGDDGGADKDTTEQDKVILRSEKESTPATTWDPENHQLINLNARVTGRLMMIEKFREDEKDQYHFLLIPDTGFESMLNAENGEHYNGALMIEIMNSDLDHFGLGVIQRLFVGQHLEIQGPLVTDIRTGHGWNEIDPALVITDLSIV